MFLGASEGGCNYVSDEFQGVSRLIRRILEGRPVVSGGIEGAFKEVSGFFFSEGF